MKHRQYLGVGFKHQLSLLGSHLPNAKPKPNDVTVSHVASTQRRSAGICVDQVRRRDQLHTGLESLAVEEMAAAAAHWNERQPPSS
jgi:hypothetical protein